MVHALVQWLLDTIGAMGYPGIMLLMAVYVWRQRDSSRKD